jgi:hypothetical protein
MFVNGVPVDVVSGAYDIAANYLKRMGVCTENLIRVDAVMESPKLAE